ncbi:hypothetical protein [Pseudolysinimonas sp.]|uniref:hypothetical protein n=1 Tax=Pseudolysinimonas sp. TaxID=2680009 RepID=UPI003F800386
MWVTPLVETIVNVADRFDAAVSIPVIDAALGGRARDSAAVRPDDLAAVPVQHAPRRVGFALGFGDGRAESVGESLSRLAIHRVGLAAPVLQARFDDDRGLVGFADFWWPDSGVIGEFDGLGKYRRDLAGRGRPPEEIVIAEKRREDRMRALGPRVVRWGWATARSVPDLRRLLMGAGVRADSSRPRR